MDSPALNAVLRTIEEHLFDFYAFEPRSMASSHLVSRQDLVEAFGGQVTSMPEFHARGGVFLCADPDDSADQTFIGIHLEPELLDSIQSDNPLECLSLANLDAFCVLVEEISHFHLIINRSSSAAQLRKVELEWQGEVDKVVVCARILKEQTGDHHLEALTRVLFDHAQVTPGAEPHYWEAIREAARFWNIVVRQDRSLRPEIREFLRHCYHSTWTRKSEAINDFGLLRAAG